jgi:8-oxo-dGTP pyrophosphatase MutT (NUDIX family)
MSGPAGLHDIREGLRAEVDKRWLGVGREVKRAIAADALQIGPQVPKLAQPTSVKADLFRRWLDEQLMRHVIRDGALFDSPIDAAASRAVGRSRGLSPPAPRGLLATDAGPEDEPRDERGRWTAEGDDVHGMPKASPDPSQPVYLRVGTWNPATERSGNYAAGKMEKGVSVYALGPHGDPVVPPEGEWAADDLRDRMRGDEPKFLVQGKLVGRGNDGEPLLRKVRVVGFHKAHVADAQQGMGFLTMGFQPPSQPKCKAAAIYALAGICDEVSERARAIVASSLRSSDSSPMRVARLLDSAFGDGLSRTRMLAEHSVTMAHAQATLDALESMGVTHVGTEAHSTRLQRVVDGAAGIMFTTPSGHVLFLRRTDGQGWAFPGGGVDEPETEENGAQREAQEELGGFWARNGLSEVSRHPNGYVTFSAQVDEPFAPHLNHEHDDWTWALVDDPPKPLHPGVRWTLRQLAHDAGFMDFDPDEPRDPAGKWTTAAGGLAGAYLIPTLRWKGKSYYGATHLQAMRGVPPDQKQELVSADRDDTIRYTTPDGKLLNRNEARQYAEQNNLLDPRAYNQPELIAEDLTAAASDPAHRRFRGMSVLAERGMSAVSPSQHEIDLPTAVAALSGEKQAKFAEASADIDQGLGLDNAKEIGVVGAWKDGAENAMVTTVMHADWDRLTVSAAMKAHLTNQKAALVFMQGDGDSALYTFHAPGDLPSIHAALIEDGVAFHSLAPDADGHGATVYVADMDGSAYHGVAKAAERFNAKVDYQIGRAEFIGSDLSEGTDAEQRAHARAAYEGVIGQSKVSGVADLWARVNARWSQALVDAIAAWFSAALKDAARKTRQAQHPTTGRFTKQSEALRERHRRRTGAFGQQHPREGVQARAERAESAFASAKGRWDVLTAGDDKVCKVCQRISDNGPYRISTARSLIPAHPHCRCAFVPYGQMQDADPTQLSKREVKGLHYLDFDPSEPRDPKGEWTTGPHTSEEWLGHINERDRARFAALAAKGALTFYHGTADKAVKAILKRGIVPHGGEGADTWFQWHGGSMQKLMVPPGFPGAARLNKERLGSVYISDEKEAAEQFANAAAEVHPGSGATVLKLTIPADRVADVVHDEMALTMPAYRFHGKIDPKWISVAERSYAGEPFPEGKHGGLQKPKDAEPPLTLYLTVLTDEASGLVDFDPGEARDKIGRWTALQGSVGHPATISSSNIAKGAGLAASKTQYRRIDLKTMRGDERVFKQNVDLFKDGRFYPGLKPGELKGSSEQQAHTIIERMRSNLDFLANAVKNGEIPGVEFEANRGWYEGAHNIADREAKASGVDIASASGVIAALSPQKDWNMNVYLAHAVFDAMSHQDRKWDDAMTDKLSIWNGKNVALAGLIKGKRLEELSNPILAGMWIRTYDEAHGERQMREVQADGSFGDVIKNATKRKGVYPPTPPNWNKVSMVANAVAAFRSGGDNALIGKAMGNRHKVRSFYNNILDPHSKNEDVTVDTHAVGAAWLQPYTGDDAPVNHALKTNPDLDKKLVGFVGAAGSDVAGIQGTYGLYAEAYREAAHDMGIEPRELQSITWVAKRKLFAEEGQTGPKIKAAVGEVWKKFHSGKLSLPEAQREVLRVSKELRA